MPRALHTLVFDVPGLLKLQMWCVVRPERPYIVKVANFHTNNIDRYLGLRGSLRLGTFGVFRGGCFDIRSPPPP